MSMFKSAATKIAHNTTLPSLGGNKDLKALQDLVTAEKAVLLSLQRLSVDFVKSSECLRTWGLGEGDDLGDILSASTNLLSHLSHALTQFASHETNVREHMKAVRTREEQLDELRRRRKALGSKAEAAEKKLSKMSPEHKSLIPQTELLNTLRDQIRSMDWDIITEEAKLGDFKRTSTKNWMMLKFGGLLECAEKATIVGELGRLVIDEISLEPTEPGQSRTPYAGQEKTEKLVAEAQRCVAEVVFDPQPVSDMQPRSMPIPSGTNPADSSGGESPHTSMPAEGPHMGDPTFSGAPSGEYTGRPESMPTSSGGYDEFGAGDGHARQYGTMPMPMPMPMPTGDEADPMPAPGQFATFPVRNSQGGTPGGRSSYQLHDGEERNGPGGLGEGAGMPGEQAAAGLDGPAPTYESHYASPSDLPRGAAPPNQGNPWEGEGSDTRHMPSVPSNVGDPSLDISDEETQLPYARASDGASEGRHVRFGSAEIVPDNREVQDGMGSGGDGDGGHDDGTVLDEQALNAAAAREVSREMDSLTFNPPPAVRAPSPLAPPAPPFAAGRSVSPDPRTVAQRGESPGRSENSSVSRGRENSFLSTSPGIVWPQPPIVQSATSSPLAPPAARFAGRTPSPAGGSTYGTPPEYPIANQSSRTISPVSSPILTPGSRTISASAFKRPQMRSSSGSDISTSRPLPEVSPLAVKKRQMPTSLSSPQIQATPPANGAPSPPYSVNDPASPVTRREASSSPVNRLTLPPLLPEHPPYSPFNPGIYGAGDSGDHYDLMASYGDGNGSPTQKDYGRLGQVQVTNGESSGYGQGRFATNLDDNLR